VKLSPRERRTIVEVLPLTRQGLPLDLPDKGRASIEQRSPRSRPETMFAMLVRQLALGRGAVSALPVFRSSERSIASGGTEGTDRWDI